jgi:tetratricopeptide (TPR) repeat protein
MSDSDVGGGPAPNVVGVSAGNTVQAGWIHGGVHFHTPAAPDNSVVPRQLPPPPPHLTGRDAELATLDRIARRDDRHGPAIVVISGQGGVGKSALALTWLHRVVDDYPDGQLYVTLTADAEPASLSAVLARLLRACGVPADQIPLDVAEAAALFRSVTAGRRLAMLVEGPASAAQVRSLLPSATACVVVVTTRWRLGGLAFEAADFVPLTPFGTEAGAELIGRAVGAARVSREPDDAARLVELCGGLPIALTIAAARLVTRPEWTIKRLVDMLSDERRRLATLRLPREMSVRELFELSYAALSTEESQAYRWLSLHPGPSFRPEVVAAVLAVPPEVAADVLDGLVDAHLLEALDAERYRFHDLVRLHARERAEHDDPAPARSGAVRKALEYHLGFAAAGDRTVMPQDWRIGPVFQDVSDGPPRYASASAALDDLEAELPNLMAALQAGAAHGFDDLVWQLCEAMWSLFLYRKHFPDWLTAHRLAVAAAERCGAGVARSRMLRRLGLAFHNMNRPDEAIAQATAALAVAREAGSERAESEALRLIGMASRSRGSLSDAVDALSRTVELTCRLGMTRDEALARRALGQTLAALRQYDKAVGELRRAKGLARELRDADVEANTTVWLSDALTRAGEPAAALALITEVWLVLQRSGSSQYQAQALMVWGEAAAAAGDLPTAHARLSQARDRYAKLGTGHRFSGQQALDEVVARLSRRRADSP